MSNEAFVLFANCRLTKGIMRTAICDLQRGAIHFIDNSFAELFVEERYFIIDVLMDKFGEQEKEIFLEYLDMLLQAELGFICKQEQVVCFPAVSDEYLYPAHITNCIMDADSELWYFDESLALQLDKLCCRHLQLRFFQQTTLRHLEDIAAIIRQSKIRSVEMVLPKPDSFTVENLVTLSIQDPRFCSFVIHSDEINSIEEITEPYPQKIVRTKSKIDDSFHCGVVSVDYFTVNLSHYIEATEHNSCLNRKLGIDKGGRVKNCPSMKESYGNAGTADLNSIISSARFQKFWAIAKSQINICNQCEFRYVCTDCRAFTESPDDDFAKPLKCGYDPSTCKWEDWSANPLKTITANHYKASLEL